jgi:hypothetical protein
VEDANKFKNNNVDQGQNVLELLSFYLSSENEFTDSTYNRARLASVQNDSKKKKIKKFNSLSYKYRAVLN